MQGRLFSTFSKITTYKDINTLDEFFATDLPVYTGLLSLFLDDNNRTSALQHKYVQYAKMPHDPKIHNSIMKMIVEYKNASWLTRRSYAYTEIKTNFTTDDGVPLLHIVPECPASFFTAYGVPMASPFRSWFNYAINAFLQAGLLYKWNNDMTEGLVNKREIEIVKKGSDSYSKPLTMQHVHAAFLIWGIGMSVSLLVFLCELFWHNTKEKKKVRQEEEKLKWGKLILFDKKVGD